MLERASQLEDHLGALEEEGAKPGNEEEAAEQEEEEKEDAEDKMAADAEPVSAPGSSSENEGDADVEGRELSVRGVCVHTLNPSKSSEIVAFSWLESLPACALRGSYFLP
jgi:hypothetical protein